jgi:SAM-dependent methyltransferase
MNTNDAPRSDQARCWSKVAANYEAEFIDPYLPEVRNPLPAALAELPDRAKLTVADLGCGVGPLLHLLAGQFRRVLAIDFAEGMLARARERCHGLANVEFHRLGLTDLRSLAGKVDVAVAVNSLVLPDSSQLDEALRQIHASLRPGGHFLGIVPAMDAVHYFTMVLLDRARRAGMPEDKARQNAAHHAEHQYYDFAFGGFRYQGLDQHFWQPFEVRYRLKRAGFTRIKLAKVELSWQQFGCARDLGDETPPWDWFFHACVGRRRAI